MSIAEGKRRVERINRLNTEIKRLEKFLGEMDEYSTPVLSSRTFMRDHTFYEQNETSKRNTGTIRMLDVPDDIDIHSMIKREAQKALTKRINELEDLYGGM